MGAFGGGYGTGLGMMLGWGGGATFPFPGIFVLLVLALVIAALVWFVRAILRPHDNAPRGERVSAGLDVLDQRYARGDQSRRISAETGRPTRMTKTERSR